MSTLRVNNIDNLGLDDVITNGVVESRALPSGSVLQVVSTTKTDAFSATVGAGSSTAVTGFTATITPTFSTSKILVFVDLNCVGGNGSVSEGYGAILKRSGTAIGIGDAAGSRARVTSMGWQGGNVHASDNVAFSHLDSPATTSAITYSIDVHNGNSSSRLLRVNQVTDTTDNSNNMRASSTITLMEIAG
jgi:hypothetical protein